MTEEDLEARCSDLEEMPVGSATAEALAQTLKDRDTATDAATVVTQREFPQGHINDF